MRQRSLVSTSLSFRSSWILAVAAGFVLLSGTHHDLCTRWLPMFANAQQRPLFVDPPMANFTSQRQNVCERTAPYSNGTVELRHALQGLQVRPLVYWTAHQLKLDADGRIDQTDPGLVAIFLDQVAKRGGFTWRDSFAAVSVVPNDTTVDGHLLWGVEHFDIYATFVTVTIDRLRRGIDFPEGWLDDHLILISTGNTNSNGDETQWLFWNWTRPFSPDVWAWIIVTCACTGVLFYGMEVMTNPAKRRQQPRNCAAGTATDTGKEVSEGMLLSAIICTGQGGVGDFWTLSFASKVLLGSMGIFGLLLSATYTANLASFYVVENVQNEGFNDINDVIAAGFPICVFRDTYGDTYVSKNYPKASLLRVSYEADLYRRLLNRDCAASVSSSNTFELYRRDNDFNGECQLRKVGDSLNIVEQGFALKVDFDDRCTSLVQAVFNVHLKEMAQEGVVKQIFDNYRQESQTVSCFDESDKQDSQEDSMTLTINQLAGTFLLHGIMTGFAILIALFTSACQVFGVNSRKHRERSSREMNGTASNDQAQQPLESPPTNIPEGVGEHSLSTSQNIEFRLAEIERNMAEITPLLKRLCNGGTSLSGEHDNHLQARTDATNRRTNVKC